ncbi:alpha-1,3-mannosyl-glycoprotein 4-beta-N-acetylglucosaminyltransferase-like protein MGAT4E [Heterocephalus glaber]|uniref:Alpha-1,3-mannosyl-glycoprotein 4-beta-N-acetylglucosaminyltransferase-like protein MGAT4E n=1 Tax=Heterocephalus glaber TaxID=10181 RepID=A0AAX6RMM0_HETGA|nr:alpha-1,3-mannosyl-glycoprotein 4-beta-N-acetylglucosaminyltransferase-like protein MGAT4E [Heterocephalus glaber]
MFASLTMEKDITLQIIQDQTNSEIKNHAGTFKEIQKMSPLLRHANYTLLAGTPPREKKLLTVGISSVQRPHGTYLLATLQSLFQASSTHDLECIVVLVHLSDPDSAWLTQTVANISELFAPHIKAQKLLVVHGLLGGSPLRNVNHSWPCQSLYSRQKLDYALLMHFDSNLSEYFLLMEDNVRCAPRFVSAIYWAVLAWKELPWVMLEFSSLRFSGKVFHTSDLTRLTSFFLLFPKYTPTHLFLSELPLFSAQNVPIHFGTPMFFHMGNYPESEAACFPAEEVEDFGESDNPAAVVFTDMTSKTDLPQYAYVLSEDSFATLDPLKGNYMTVVLDRLQKVTRILVHTGSKIKGLYRLEQGQVLPGYDHLQNHKDCAHYTLLGPLVAGNLDQRVIYEEDSVQELSCIKLLVLASQNSWLLIREIKVWAEPEKEEYEWAQ